jgi:hypothetical protein
MTMENNTTHTKNPEGAWPHIPPHKDTGANSHCKYSNGSPTTWTLPNGSTITFTPSKGKSLIRGMGTQAIGPYIDVTEEELDEYLSENK